MFGRLLFDKDRKNVEAVYNVAFGQLHITFDHSMVLEWRSNTIQKQRRIQPVRLGRAISVTFGSQVPLGVHYRMNDEVYFTTLL